MHHTTRSVFTGVYHLVIFTSIGTAIIMTLIYQNAQQRSYISKLRKNIHSLKVSKDQLEKDHQRDQLATRGADFRQQTAEKERDSVKLISQSLIRQKDQQLQLQNQILRVRTDSLTALRQMVDSLYFLYWVLEQNHEVLDRNYIYEYARADSLEAIVALFQRKLSTSCSRESNKKPRINVSPSASPLRSKPKPKGKSLLLLVCGVFLVVVIMKWLGL